MQSKTHSLNSPLALSEILTSFIVEYRSSPILSFSFLRRIFAGLKNLEKIIPVLTATWIQNLGSVN